MLVFLLILGEGLRPVSTINAAPQSVITVNSLADDLEMNRNCTLREALRAAAVNTAWDGCAAGSPDSADLIVFSVNGTIEMALGEYVVATEVTIRGNGRDQTIIDAGNHSRAFRLIPTDAPQTIKLEDLSLQNGNSPEAGGAIYAPLEDQGPIILELDNVVIQDSRASSGGAIYTDHFIWVKIQNSLLQRNTASNSGGALSVSNLTIEDSVVQDNQVGFDAFDPEGGGGIHGEAGDISITRTLVQRNQVINSSRGGGGLYCNCTLTLTDSTLRDNTADLSGNGGGLAGSSDVSWTIQGSTISGNNAEFGSGGGIFFESIYAEFLLITNSTISGNTALLGGGVALQQFGGEDEMVNIRFTTIADNTALSLLGAGGAIFVNPGSNPVTLSRNIVYGNTGTPTCYLSGDIVSSGYNLWQDTSCGSHPMDQVGVNPQLGPLSDNGGLTYTHALLTNSPAIDAALCLGGISTDQRGANRPQGARCDSGAFEFGGLIAGLYLPLMRGNP